MASGAEVVRGTPHGACVGGHLWAHGLDQHEAFGPVVAQLTQAVAAHKQTHPEEDFARLPPRESTRVPRFEALFFAPLLGSDRLRACDTHAPPLQTLLGRGDQSATRRQWLGQRERGQAAVALRPGLGAAKTGQIVYVDGHRIASWSRRSRQKGTSPMRGRIMAGWQAVIAHEATGQAILVAYSPPALHLSQGIVAYGQQGAEASGSVVLVIDRAVKAGA